MSVPDTSRVGPPPSKVARTSKPKLFIADGKETPLKGTCLVFTRMPGSKNTAVTEANITKVSVNWVTDTVVMSSYVEWEKNSFGRNKVL